MKSSRSDDILNAIFSNKKKNEINETDIDYVNTPVPLSQQKRNYGSTSLLSLKISPIQSVLSNDNKNTNNNNINNNGSNNNILNNNNNILNNNNVFNNNNILNNNNSILNNSNNLINNNNSILNNNNNLINNNNILSNNNNSNILTNINTSSQNILSALAINNVSSVTKESNSIYSTPYSHYNNNISPISSITHSQPRSNYMLIQQNQRNNEEYVEPYSFEMPLNDVKPEPLLPNELNISQQVILHIKI